MSSLSSATDATFSPASFNQPTKRWFITAAAIGVLVVVVVGGVGILGLLHSHKVISLPPEIAAIGRISNSGLWAMSIGGVLGGGIIIYSSYKIHKIRKEKRPESKLEPELKHQDDELWSQFKRDNFQKIGLDLNNYKPLRKKTFVKQGCPENYWIVIRNQGGRQCTEKMTASQLQLLEQGLQKEGYVEATAQTLAQLKAIRCRTNAAKELRPYFGKDFVNVHASLSQWEKQFEFLENNSFKDAKIKIGKKKKKDVVVRFIVRRTAEGDLESTRSLSEKAAEIVKKLLVESGSREVKNKVNIHLP